MKIRFLIAPLLGFALLTGCEKPAGTDATGAEAPPAAEESAASADPAKASAAPETVVEEESVQVTLTEDPSAPAAAPIVLPDPVAQVNGQPIAKAEFEQNLNEIFSWMWLVF